MVMLCGILVLSFRDVTVIIHYLCQGKRFILYKHFQFILVFVLKC